MISEVVIAMVLGLVIGSFLNVCIYRIPEGQSIHYPRSHCRWCKHTLGPLDLIPVLSYIFLGGKCRYCKKKVASQYIVIELINSLLYGMVIYWLGISMEGILACVLISSMLILSVIDMRYMLLPTKIIATSTALAFLIRAVVSLKTGDIHVVLEGVWGGLVGYGILLIVFYGALILTKKEGMGYGDVRYLGMIGSFTSWQLVLLIMFLAAVIGSLYGIGLLLIKKKSQAFPFGPFLSLGGLISMLWGDAMIHWYLLLLS